MITFFKGTEKIKFAFINSVFVTHVFVQVFFKTINIRTQGARLHLDLETDLKEIGFKKNDLVPLQVS